jgi:hypothetical protein
LVPDSEDKVKASLHHLFEEEHGREAAVSKKQVSGSQASKEDFAGLVFGGVVGGEMAITDLACGERDECHCLHLGECSGAAR